MESVPRTPQLDQAFQEALLVTGVVAGDHTDPRRRTTNALYGCFPPEVLEGHVARDPALSVLLASAGKQLPKQVRRRLFNQILPFDRLKRAETLLDESRLEMGRDLVLRQALRDMAAVIRLRLRDWGVSVETEDPESLYASVMGRSMDPTPEEEREALFDARALALDRAGFPITPDRGPGEAVHEWVQEKKLPAETDPHPVFQSIKTGFIEAMRGPLLASALPASTVAYLLDEALPGVEIRYDPTAPQNFSAYLGGGRSVVILKEPPAAYSLPMYERLLEHELGHALQTALGDRLYTQGQVGVESQMALMPSAAVTFQEGFADGFVPLICGGSTVEEMIEKRGADYALMQTLIRIRNMVAHDYVRKLRVEREDFDTVKAEAEARYGLKNATSLHPYGRAAFDLLYGEKANHCGVQAVMRVVAKRGFTAAFDRALHCSGFMDVNRFIGG